ncbi:hypothetical protein BXY66_3980 [Shimia isoporae]|uniref:Uncharacterized protein n=1 Tax=Shimia isoporae TaxID=647720 RepID=A0A4R1N0Z7_9RHOB|nr:hypothetical protein [Shimia isoporae]TCK99475.1 hypothetical protein BXY66_3980 [Shimia isoporae]
MKNAIQSPPGLSNEEIDQLMDPLLSIEERQSVWRKKPLGVQARNLQEHWKGALRGPFELGLVSCGMAIIALIVATFSDTWRLAGITAFLLWYPMMFYVLREMHRLSRLRVNEI